MRRNGEWEAAFVRRPDAQSPAGGVSSSVNDLAQWLRLQLRSGAVGDRQLIDAEALSETHRPQIAASRPANANDRTWFYGLGWNVSYDDRGRLKLGHTGAFALGAATHVTIYPNDQLAMAVLTNAYPIGVAEGLADSFFDILLHGTATNDWVKIWMDRFARIFPPLPPPPTAPSDAVPPLPDTAYVGSYRNSYYGVVRVSADTAGASGSLAMTIGPQDQRFSLRHFDGNVFLYDTVGENAGGAAKVAFDIGSDGRAGSVTVENLDEEGLGTFRREKTVVRR